MGHTKRTYTYELKKKVVELYFEGNTSQELADAYDIANRRRVSEWVKIVREHGYDALKFGIPKDDRLEEKIKNQKLRKEIERLKLENEYLKKRIKLERR